MQNIKGILVIGLSAACLMPFVCLGQERIELPPGSIVTFLLNDSDPQPVPPSRPNDMLVYTGRPLGLVDATGCAVGSHPLQKVVLIDRDALKAPMNIEAISISESAPIPPGTRLVSVRPVTMCTLNGLPYTRYEGTVE